MSDPLCAKCGKPRSNHPYRHPFVGPSMADTITAQQAEIERLRGALRLEVKRSRRHLAASTLAIVEEMETKP